MSEEEKKEIEREEQYTDFYKDLCNKQQKEIEEKNCLIDVLQHKIEELLDNKKEINYIKPIDIPVHNYISKDKIREKIKEITNYDYTSIEERECQVYARQVLKELLEENTNE